MEPRRVRLDLAQAINEARSRGALPFSGLAAEAAMEWDFITLG
jgi:hypothetical protein